MKKRNKKDKKDKFINRQMKSTSISNPYDISTYVSIPMYAPNIGLTPKEYQISPQLNDLEIGFKSLCIEFLSKANPDQFNSSYMDALIERVSLDCIKFIKVQRADHERLISDTLQVMYKGDYCAAQNKLQYFLDDKEQNKKLLSKLRKILWAGTSLSEEV